MEQRTDSEFEYKKNEGVTFLTYPAFEDVEWLVHGFSTRLGGVSQEYTVR